MWVQNGFQSRWGIFALVAMLSLSACAPESRSETRAVISGNIVLHDVDGLNDMSRVRVDIGRGEGGSALKEDGRFVFQDLAA